MTEGDAAAAQDSITVGDGTNVKASKAANIRGMMCDKHGNELHEATLQDVTHLPDGKFNLFSSSKLLKQGWKLTGDKMNIRLAKDAQETVFDIVAPTTKGLLFATCFRRNSEIAGAMTDIQRMSIKEAHDKLGHADENAIRKAAKALEIETLRGAMKACEGCAVAKAKQKNVPKESHETAIASKEERRMFLDVSTVKKMKDGPNVTKPNWLIIVDQRSALKFTQFCQTKDGMVEPTCQLLNKWKQENMPVKHVRLDNAGENELLKTRTQSKDWKLNLTFEFTARDTPQQNHLAELGFASLANKGRALMARANVPLKVRYKLFKEAFATATLLDGLMTVEVDCKLATRCQHFCGKNPAFVKDLRIWGEAGTVKIKKTGAPKIADRGTQCVMVGCPEDHTSDCHRMWNPITNRIHETRDVIWLKRMHFTKPALEHDVLIHTPPPPAAPVIEAGESVASSGESEEKEDEEAPEEPKIVSRSGRQAECSCSIADRIASRVLPSADVLL
jgi:hypothetical protein